MDEQDLKVGDEVELFVYEDFGPIRNFHCPVCHSVILETKGDEPTEPLEATCPDCNTTVARIGKWWSYPYCKVMILAVGIEP